MSKKTMKRVSIAALALALGTGSLLCGTLAKYQSKYTGTDDITVAKWAVSVGGKGDTSNGENAAANALTTTETATFKFTLDPEKDAANVVEGMIAPGIGGSFAVETINTGDVAVEYTFEFTASNVPTNVVFYKDSACTEALTASDGKYTMTTSKLAIGSTTEAKETITVYWNWVYETEGTETKEDTDDGLASATSTKKMSVTVNVVATQAKPSVADTGIGSNS